MKKVVRKFYDQWNNVSPDKGEKNFPQSLAQPVPMTLKQMVERYVQTGELPESQRDIYYEEDELEPRNFDLSDITEAQAIIAAAQQTKKGGNKGNVAKQGDDEGGDVASNVPPVSDPAAEPLEGGAE